MDILISLGVGLGFVLVALVIVFSVRRVKEASAMWANVADELGLTFTLKRFGRPEMTGNLGDLSVFVDVFREQTHLYGNGKSTQNFTRYWVIYPSLEFYFRLTKQTGFTSVKKFFGAQDAKISDSHFDEAFEVKTSDPSAMRSWLNPRRRDALLRTGASYPHIRITNNKLSYRTNGLEKSRDTLVSTVRRLTDTAGILAGQQSDERAEDLLAARQRGELAEAADRIRTLDSEHSGSIDEQLLEVDTLATSGDRSGAKDRIRKLEKQIPADPDVRGWNERLNQSPVTSTKSLMSSPDPATLSKELFGHSTLSFESKQIFDEKYRGAIVRWNGTFKSAEPIRKSSDLGVEGDTRLIVTVATISHDLYGNTDIDAVVGMSPESATNFQRGEKVAFSGTLVRVDALVRNLFVAEGKLE